MKKILTVAAFAALAFAACGDSGSDSVPTSGTPADDLFGAAWVSTNTSADDSEVVTFERTSVPNFAKMKKYLTCSDNRFSIVETDIKIGKIGLDVAKEVSGNNDDGCQAVIKKDNYKYEVTPSTLSLAATSGEKKQLTYKRKGKFSCEFQNYQKSGHACSDYYNDSIPPSACAKLGGVLNVEKSCAERVSKTHKQICRYKKVASGGSGKELDFVLTFYDVKVNCDKFPAALYEEFIN